VQEAVEGRPLHFCYEAGPCGYGVQRHLTRLGHHCDVVALIPRKVGDKVKTDRRDAMMLAQTLRAGQLTAVWVPDEAHEAMRDLVRLRAQAMRDLRKTRQHLLSFLLRHGITSPYGHWTKMHRRWLGELTFAHPAQHLAHEEMLQRIERAEALCDRLKRAIAELVAQWSLAPVVQAIQALRGVLLVVAAVIVAEVGSFGRFDNPRQLMAYLGIRRSIPVARRSGVVRSPSLERGRRLGVTPTTAWKLKHKLMQVMMERDAGKRLTGRVEMDDAYLGGERSGGKRGRGAPGKTPIIVAVETAPEGKPVRLKLRRVEGFRRKEVEKLARRSLDPTTTVLSDGLGCFRGVADARMHASADPHRIRPQGGADTRLQVGQHGARQHQDRHHRHIPRHPPKAHPPLPGRIRIPLQSALRSRRHDAPPRLGRRPNPANAIPPPQTG
jgi:transposase